jgi:hypothetical protein
MHGLSINEFPSVHVVLRSALRPADCNHPPPTNPFSMPPVPMFYQPQMAPIHPMFGQYQASMDAVRAWSA